MSVEEPNEHTIFRFYECEWGCGWRDMTEATAPIRDGGCPVCGGPVENRTSSIHEMGLRLRQEIVNLRLDFDMVIRAVPTMCEELDALFDKTVEEIGETMDAAIRRAGGGGDGD